MTATLLSIVAVLAAIAVLAHAVADSRRHSRVTPTLYLVVAFGSAAWLEPFFDWGLYATFSDDWVRSSTGYLDLAGNGLPLAAIPLYAVYFFLAGTAGVALTEQILGRRRWPRPVALLLVGYGVGFCFDLAVELILPRFDLYEFTHVARGWVPFAESSNQLPLGMPLGMATIIAGATYLIGLSDGKLVTERWARKLTPSRHTLATFALTIVAFNLFMGVAAFPFLITRWAGWNTVVDPAYGTSTDAAPYATFFFVAWNATVLGLMVLAAYRWDRPEHRTALPVARTPLRAARRGVGMLLAIGMAFSLPACGNQLPKEQLLADARGGVTLQQASQGLDTAPGATIADPTPLAPGARATGQVGTPAAATDGAAPAAPRTAPDANSKVGSAAATGTLAGAKAGTSSQTACAAPKSEVAIGTVGSESGVIGAAVRPGTDAVKAWVADMNSRGGVNCHPIKYYVADDGADTSRNAALTQQMVDERHVIAMLFLSAPLSSQAGRPILERAHVPTIGGEGGDEFFNTSPDFFPIAAMGNNLIAANYGMLGESLTSTQKRALGVLTCLEARICSAFGGPEAKTIAEGFGMKVLYSAQSTLVQPDYTSNCQSAKNAGVQAMFVAADGSMLSRVIRSCNKIGFHPQFATSPVAIAASVVELPEMEGLLLGGSTQPWTAPSVVAKRYVASLAKYVAGAAPAGAGGLGWAAAIALEWACKNLPDNPTPQDVENGLSTIKNNDFGGYTVPLTYAKGKPAGYPVCWWTLQVRNKTVVSPNGDKKGCADDRR